MSWKEYKLRNAERWWELAIAVVICATQAGCGAPASNSHEHKWQEASCDQPQICITCGETYGSALGHNWQEATCISPKKCAICGKVEGKKSNQHIWKAATCVEPEICSVCGKENLYSSPFGHDWIPATINLPYICKKCGAENGEPIPLSSFNRGHSAAQYVGLNGYVAITQLPFLYSLDESPYENKWFSKPWYATTYEKDKQFWNATGTVEHKTEVRVIEEELTDWNHATRKCQGFLLVERIDNNERLYISVTDFVAEPYWENADINHLTNGNPLLAIYHQCSDYYPVDRNNRKADIADGEKVLIGDDELWGGINRETNQIAGKTSKGPFFFNADDLQIIY